MYSRLETYFRDRTNIDDDTLVYVCSHFISLAAKRNEILLREGEICRYYYFVNRGCLRLFTSNKNGIECTRHFAFEGSFGTALPSFIQGTPAFEFVQTIEKSELLAISRNHFFMLVDTVPAVALIYRRILEISFIAAQKRIYGFQGWNGMKKMHWVMQYNPSLLTRVSNKMAASFLGLSPSTLSRLKAQL